MWGTADGGRRTAGGGGGGETAGKRRVGARSRRTPRPRLFHDRCLNLAVYENLAAAVAGFRQGALGLLYQIGG
jgi:hypothetical protein